MSPPDRHAQALQLARAGQFAAAAEALQAVLGEHPDDVASWSLMAAVRQRLDQPAAALACHNALVALTPDDPDAHLARGAVLARLGHLPEALDSFDRAADLAPQSAFAHSNRASMLMRLDRLTDALAAADRALALDDSLVHAWRHRGFALLGLGDAEAAVVSYARAVQTAAPGEAYDALTDLAVAQAATGRDREAIATLDQAVAGRPGASAALVRRAETRLRLGDFARGWEDMEARLREPGFLRAHAELTPAVLARLVANPRADDLAGRRVLVVGEQGLGDQIMLAGALPDLAAIAGQVACIVDPRLMRLFARSLPQVAFAPAGGGRALDLDDFDRVIALGSLPLMFRREAVQFSGAPYLAPSPEVTERWRRRLDGQAPGLRVGLSWRGGSTRTRGVSRSMELAALRPLLDRPDCAFVSLQYGDVDAEIAAVNGSLARPVLSFPADDIRDMDEVAGLVGALDVVVTVQTTLAHLTGAIGAPGLVMIPRWAEWRYGREGEHMPWYGSLRLLRQPEPDDWASVIAEVGRRLDRLAPSGPAR